MTGQCCALKMFDLGTQEMSFTDGELIFEQGTLAALASVRTSFMVFMGSMIFRVRVSYLQLATRCSKNWIQTLLRRGGAL